MWIESITNALGPTWWTQIERVIERDEIVGNKPMPSVLYPELRIILKSGAVINLYANGDDMAHMEIELITWEGDL